MLIVPPGDRRCHAGGEDPAHVREPPSGPSSTSSWASWRSTVRCMPQQVARGHAQVQARDSQAAPREACKPPVRVICWTARNAPRRNTRPVMTGATSRTPTSRTATSRTAIRDGDRQLRRTAVRFGEEFRPHQASNRREPGSGRASDRGRPSGDLPPGGRRRERVGADSRSSGHRAGRRLPARHLPRSRAAHPRCRARRGSSRRCSGSATQAGGRGSRRPSRGRAAGRPISAWIAATRPSCSRWKPTSTRSRSIIREGEDKRAAVVAEAGSGRRIHVVLVLPTTRHHRALVDAHPEIIGSAFPAASSDIRRALATAGVPWPGDGILWLGAAARQRASPLAPTPGRG